MTNEVEALHCALETASAFEVIARQHRKQAGRMLAQLQHDHPNDWRTITGLDPLTADLLLDYARTER